MNGYYTIQAIKHHTCESNCKILLTRFKTIQNYHQSMCLYTAISMLEYT